MQIATKRPIIVRSASVAQHPAILARRKQHARERKKNRTSRACIPCTVLARTGQMTEQAVSITLSADQVATVVRQASSGAGMLSFLAGATEHPAISAQLRDMPDDRAYSRTVVRAVLILSALADGQEHEQVELARQLHLNASTVHRYLATWVAIGLVYRDPRTRRYRRAMSKSNEAWR